MSRNAHACRRCFRAVYDTSATSASVDASRQRRDHSGAHSNRDRRSRRLARMRARAAIRGDGATLPTTVTTRYRIAVLTRTRTCSRSAARSTIPIPAASASGCPSWIPGSYLIREFARHFVPRARRSAAAAGRHRQGSEGHLARGAVRGPLTVIARRLRVRSVGAHRVSRRDARLLQRRRRCSCARKAARTRPARSRSSRRMRCRQRDWRVATTLPRAGAADCGFGTYRAVELRRADRSSGRDVATSRSRRSRPAARATTSRSPAASTPISIASRAIFARVCQWQIDLFGGAAGEPRAVRALSVPGRGRRRRLRRARASREHEPAVQARRAAAARRRQDRPTTTAASSVSRATSTSTAGT